MFMARFPVNDYNSKRNQKGINTNYLQSVTLDMDESEKLNLPPV
jgi:hypothetical protein